MMRIIEIEERETYIKVRMSPGQEVDLYLAEQWCRRAQCGKRINRNSFAFYTEAELTMFRLRWVTA